MQYLQIVRTVLALLPLIIQAVQAIEAALPDGGQGEAKLAALRRILEGAYGVAADSATAFEQLWPALSATIGAVVGLFNTSGLFKTTPSAGAAR